MKTLSSKGSPGFLRAHGEMAKRIREYDWSSTPIGSPEQWPQNLRIVLGILLQSKFPMFLFWGEELVCFYNDAFRPSLGNDGKHPWALGKNGQEVWSEIWPAIGPWIHTVLHEGESIWMEDQMVGFYRNGSMEEVYWTFSYSPVPDESGGISGVLVTCTETTEKVRNLRMLEESNDELLFAIEATELGIWDLNPLTGKFKANTRLKSWFALEPGEDMELQKALELIAAEDQPLVNAAIERALQYESGGRYEIDYTIVHPQTKKERRVRAKGRAWFGEDKLAYRFNGTLQDITAEYIATKQVSQRERAFREMVQQAPVGIAILRGTDFMVDLANETYLQMVGRSADDLIGRLLFEAVPEVRNTVESLLRNVLETGIPFHATEFPAPINRNGIEEVNYFNFIYKPLRDEGGSTTGIIVVVNEVTALVSAKYKLQESEKQFRNLVMQSPIGMAVFRGEELVIEMANEVMLGQLWRRKEADVIGKSLVEVFPELAAQKFPSVLKDIFKTGKPYREKEARAFVNGDDGMRCFYLDYEYAPIFDSGGAVSHIMVSVNDVTEKAEARHYVELAEERTRVAAEAAELGIYELNLETDEWNTTRKLAEIFGVEHPSGRDRYVQVVHPDDVPRRQEAYDKAIDTGGVEYEARVIHKDGSIHWVRVKGKIYFSPEGRPLRQMGIAQDITEQKQFEEELSRQVKERTKELESKNRELERSNANLEEFAHAASHDLKEPVRKIHFFTGRLKDQLDARLSKDENFTLERIENAAQRMTALIDDLLMYSHVNQRLHEMEEVDLQEKIQRILEDLEVEIEQKQAVIRIGALPCVKGYRRQLQQLFQNLIGNALKYSKPGVRPQISIDSRIVKGEDAPALFSGEERQTAYHCIEVKDEGIGFPQEDAERIFMMFQRLHGRSEYPGTGIGLAIVKKVAENHGGKVGAQSRIGEGSVFSVYLPFGQ